jgi:hypothetical protein
MMNIIPQDLARLMKEGSIEEPVWTYPPATKKTRSVTVTKSRDNITFVTTFKRVQGARVSVKYKLDPFVTVITESHYDAGSYHTTVNSLTFDMGEKIHTSDGITSVFKNGVLTVTVPRANVE